MSALLDTLRLNAPFAVVALLLAAAAASLCVRGRWAAWGAALIASTFAALVSADLFLRVIAPRGGVRVGLGGAALGADGIGAFAGAMLACLAVLVVIALAAPRLRNEDERVAPLTLGLALLVAAGWIAAAYARDLATLFIGAQTAWLAAIGMVGAHGGRDRAALSAALRMLIAGGAASAFLLLGLALIARGAGGLDFISLSRADAGADLALAVGVGLASVALAVLAGAAPFNAWAAPAHGRAGGGASLALAALGQLGALLALARLAAAAAQSPGLGESLSAGLIALGLAGVLYGSAQAIGAAETRRLGAYAMSAQIGCILVSLGLGSPAAHAAALLQIVALAGAALAHFSAASVLPSPAPLALLDGLARRAPLAGAALTLAGLCFMGAPLTLGFLGRFRLIEAGVGGGWWWAAGAVIAASLAAVFFGGRLIGRLYFRRASTSAESVGLWTVAALAPAMLAAMLVIAMGVAPQFWIHAAETAARILPEDIR